MNRLNLTFWKPFARFLSPRRPAVQVGILVIVLSLIQTASGGFDSDAVSFGHRFALWLVVTGLVAGQFLLVTSVLVRWSVLATRPPWPAWLIAFFLVWPAVTIEVEGLKRTPLLAYQRPDPLLEFAVFMLPGVIFVCGAIIVIELLAARAGRREEEAARWKPSPLDTEPRRDDWPAEPFLSIEAQDHYLQITTAGAAHLVRGSMSEAIARTEPASGLRVHRSWWVARDAVLRAERRGRDHVLILKDGRDIPVARGRIGLLRDAGWL